jgi:hypothetical protein
MDFAATWLAVCRLRRATLHVGIHRNSSGQRLREIEREQLTTESFTFVPHCSSWEAMMMVSVQCHYSVINSYGETARASLILENRRAYRER